MLDAMRPFHPRLRVLSDKDHPRRLNIESDVPERAHAITAWTGAPFVAMALGVGQLLEPLTGSLVAAGLPILAALIVAVAWLALPALSVRLRIGGDALEIQRGSGPVTHFLPEEIASVHLVAGSPPHLLAPWRLGDRVVEIVPVRGEPVRVALAEASQARALASGLAALLRTPLRDDTPEAEAAFCLQQALLAAGSLSAAPDPPEGFRLRASLDRGWLVLSVPGRSTSVAGAVTLAAIGAALFVGPALVGAWPQLAGSTWPSLGLTVAAVAWLGAVTFTVSRWQQRAALAVSPLGVRIVEPRLGRSPRPVQMVAPVKAFAGSGSFELRGEARLRLRTSARPADVAWACRAITALAGRPLGTPAPTQARQPAD